MSKEGLKTNITEGLCVSSNCKKHLQIAAGDGRFLPTMVDCADSSLLVRLQPLSAGELLCPQTIRQSGWMNTSNQPMQFQHLLSTWYYKPTLALF